MGAVEICLQLGNEYKNIQSDSQILLVRCLTSLDSRVLGQTTLTLLAQPHFDRLWRRVVYFFLKMAVLCLQMKFAMYFVSKSQIMIFRKKQYINCTFHNARIILQLFWRTLPSTLKLCLHLRAILKGTMRIQTENYISRPAICLYYIYIYVL